MQRSQLNGPRRRSREACRPTRPAAAGRVERARTTQTRTVRRGGLAPPRSRRSRSFIGTHHGARRPAIARPGGRSPGSRHPADRYSRHRDVYQHHFWANTVACRCDRFFAPGPGQIDDLFSSMASDPEEPIRSLMATDCREEQAQLARRAEQVVHLSDRHVIPLVDGRRTALRKEQVVDSSRTIHRWSD